MHTTWIAATLLCGRKLMDSMDSNKPNLAKQHFVATANFVIVGASMSSAESMTGIWP